LGKIQLKTILDNIIAAEQLNRPVCQDTGVISFLRSRSLDYKNVETAMKRATVYMKS